MKFYKFEKTVRVSGKQGKSMYVRYYSADNVEAVLQKIEHELKRIDNDYFHTVKCDDMTTCYWLTEIKIEAIQ